MPALETRTAILSDAVSLAKSGLREWDLREMKAVRPNYTAANIIAGCIKASTFSVTAEYDGEVVAVGGVQRVPGTRIGSPWMLANDKVYEHPISTAKVMQRYVNDWRAKYLGLYNWVAFENDDGIRLIQLLGFDVHVDAGSIQNFGGLQFVAFSWGDFSCAG